MRPSNLLHLYRIRLRARLVQELLALVGIAAGVALLYAASVANTSLTESVERLTTGIVGHADLQLAARSSDGFEERLLSRVERLPGVEAAAPMLDLQVNLVGPRGRKSVLLVGGDPRFARLGGGFLHAFRSQALARARMIAVPASLAHSIGLTTAADASIEFGGRSREAVVGVLLDRPDVGDIAASPIVIAPLAHVQRLSGRRGRLSRIYVRLEPGGGRQAVAGLRRLAGDGLMVRPARFDVELFDKAAVPTHASTTLFFAFSAGVGFLFAFSAMLLTVPQRRRLMGDLRTDGYGAGVVLQVYALDALVLGAAASAVGIGVGELLSQTLFGPTPGYLGYTFPIGSERIVTARSVILATAGGMLASLAAIVVPYGRVQRDGRARSKHRAASGLLAGAVGTLGVTAAVLLALPGFAIVGMATLLVAALFLLPLALSGGLVLLEYLTHRWKDAAPAIALVQLRSRDRRIRAGAIAATGTLAVLTCVAMHGARTDLQRGLDAAVRDIDSSADVWITAAGESNTFATTTIREGLEAKLGDVPGIERVRRYRGSFLDWNDRRVWVLAPPAEVAAPVPASQVDDSRGTTRASELVRAGGWAVVARHLAEDHGLQVGDRFTLPSPVPLKLRVAGLSTNLGWPPGAIVLNGRDYARGWGTAAASAYHLTISAEASAGRVASAVRQALGGGDAALAVETADERVERHYASTRDALARLSQIRTLVLGAAVLAMAAALIGLMWQRRPQIERLKEDGFSDREIRRALVIETLVLLGASAALGAALGLCGQILLSRGLRAITGFPVMYAPDVSGAITGAIVVVAAGAALVALPGAVAARFEAPTRAARH